MWDAYQNDPVFGDTGCPSGGRHEYLCTQVSADAIALNIGAGSGSLERQLIAKGVEVHTLDPSETTINRLREELELGERAKVGYSQAIPFADGSFDVVIMTEVLEHLPDKALNTTLPEVSRVLRSGGEFIGTVPADEDLVQSLVVCPHCEQRFHRWGHVQKFTSIRLQQFLEAHFVEVSIRRRVFDDFRALNLKGKAAYVLRALQAHLGVIAANQHFYFTSRKR